MIEQSLAGHFDVDGIQFGPGLENVPGPAPGIALDVEVRRGLAETETDLIGLSEAGFYRVVTSADAGIGWSGGGRRGGFFRCRSVRSRRATCTATSSAATTRTSAASAGFTGGAREPESQFHAASGNFAGADRTDLNAFVNDRPATVGFSDRGIAFRSHIKHRGPAAIFHGESE